MTISSKAFYTVLFFTLSFFVACKKSSAPPSATPPPPTVTSPSVTALLSASLQPGDTVTILGKNLGTTIANLNIALNDSIHLTVYQAKDSVVTVILPGVGHFPYYGSHSFELDFTLSGSP